MTNPPKSTNELILESARHVFIRKGYAGSRMQEIADGAGINKALLHYYFRSKDHLFEAVFAQAIGSFVPIVKNILEADMPLNQKLIMFVETYVDVLLSNPHIPAFVIQELNMNPGRFADKLKNFGLNPELIIHQINMEIKSGHIRPVKADHFMVSLLGMCLFPFIARPVVQGILKKSNEQYESFLMERKEQIIQFIMHSIAVS